MENLAFYCLSCGRELDFLSPDEPILGSFCDSHCADTYDARRNYMFVAADDYFEYAGPRFHNESEFIFVAPLNPRAIEGANCITPPVIPQE